MRSGVVMYEMLTGRTPFLGEVEMVILYGHVYAEPLPMQQTRPDIPAALIQLVDRAMAKSPDARFQTAGEMALATCQ